MKIKKPSIAPLHDVVSVSVDARDLRRHFSDYVKACRRNGQPVSRITAFNRVAQKIRYRSSTHLAELEIAELNAGTSRVSPPIFGGSRHHHIVREIDRCTTSLLDW